MNMTKSFTVTILKPDEPNANGRIYLRETVEKIIEQSREDKNRLLGTVGMPAGTTLDLTGVSHMVNNLRIIEHGDLVGEVMVLDTPIGAVLSKMLHDGEVDFRMAGTGTVDENGVVSNYQAISINAVLDGA